MIDPLTDIEKAIIARVKRASDEKIFGYSIPVAGYYKGELDEDIAFLLKNRSPAIWITQGELSAGDVSLTSRELEASFEIYLFIRNVKSEVASRQGTENAVGMNRLVSDIIKLLDQQMLDLDLETPLEYSEGVPIHAGAISGHFISIYALKFKTVCRQDIYDDVFESNDVEKFKELSTTWEIGENTQFETLVKLPQTEKENSDGGE